MSGDLDPDALAELEQEQAFLLTSLEDLDAELAAGDLDHEDHAQLDDDYTRRLAEVTRAIEERRQAFADADTRLNGRQRFLTIVGVLILAVVAGVLLARASGFRSPTDSVTGDIRQSSTGLLAEADTLTREGRWPEAVVIYDEVLDVSPANTEALTYRGWLTAQLGDPDAGLEDIDEAIAIDPAYPDARVFRAILLDGRQRFDEAAEELAVLDGLDAPDEILDLVDGFGLRASVVGGQIVERFGAQGTVIDLGEIDAPVDDVVAAAVVLLDLDPELSLRVFTAVLEVDPDNFTSLVASGNLQTNPAIVAADPEVAALGLEKLDRALELQPEANQVRLSRASARASLGDVDGAASDLALVDVTALPPELTGVYDALIAEFG